MTHIKSRKVFGDVGGAAGAKSEGGVQGNVFDIFVIYAAAGGASTQNLAAGRAGNFGFELESALETLLAGSGIVDQGVIDLGDVLETTEVEIDVAAIFGERKGGERHYEHQKQE